MKELKSILAVLFLSISLVGFAQKIKTKEGVVLMDKVPFLKIRADKVSRKCYILSNLKGEDIIYLKMNSYNDPSTVKPTTPGHYSDGNVYYYEAQSADLEKIYFENRLSGCLFGCDITDDVVSQIYNGEVVDAEGKINDSRMNILSKKIGFEFSRKRDEINRPTNNGQTIIIKEEPQRSGVNINIGR